MTKADETEWLRKRLDAIIQLLLENGDSAAKSVTDKIGRLLDMGFSPAETAQVVGKPSNYVGAIAGRKRKKDGRARKGKAKKHPAAEPTVDAAAGDAT